MSRTRNMRPNLLLTQFARRRIDYRFLPEASFWEARRLDYVGSLHQHHFPPPPQALTWMIISKMANWEFPEYFNYIRNRREVPKFFLELGKAEYLISQKRHVFLT